MLAASAAVAVLMLLQPFRAASGGADVLRDGRNPAQGAAQPLRLGLIGLDTSHVVRFSELLNDPARPDHIPGARIVAAFKGGSPDVEASATRIERFTAEVTGKYGVELVGSIEELVTRVDGVLLTSVDGRPHLAQARPVIAARKPLFIDKPMAASLHDAREIFRLAREAGSPVFSASSRRFAPEVMALKARRDTGRVLGAFTFGPAPTEPHHPDLFWYGIHSVETLYALLGTGCEDVTRTHSPNADIITGRWKDGRLGTVRGTREGDEAYGAVLFGTDKVAATPALAPPAPTPAGPGSGPADAPPRSAYQGLMDHILAFMRSGKAPVAAEETLEILAFMEAADRSKANKGAPAALERSSR